MERLQIGLTPEFNTETIQSVVMLADGEYRPSLDSDPLHNRLEIRIAGSQYTGDEVSLIREDSDGYLFNPYLISADYKMDVRTNGRFINMRITDDVRDDSIDETLFNQNTEWNVSGLQIEYIITGRR